ncbi:histone-like nucleoid-structuring protein Lsr2 [Amycolatopsis sp. VC5-11]|uniref:histone-like nucleoid-structuring protein Lsr2 n=1 Tax=Amycolatopsis sp. VC5-11 TaxID=3120156 RepID=UPI00300BC684
MVQKHVVSLVDDIDGSDADETVDFGLDGAQYEIDLSQANADDLRDALAQYIEHARRTHGRKQTRRASTTRAVAAAAKPRAAVDREQNQAIRAWAHKNGYDVADRGRIADHVVQAYHKRR